MDSMTVEAKIGRPGHGPSWLTCQRASWDTGGRVNDVPDWSGTSGDTGYVHGRPH